MYSVGVDLDCVHGSYVTAVGATQAGSVDGVQQEVVASIEAGSSITSGGGFSELFLAPAWQQEALDSYGNSPSPAGNISMRGVPVRCGHRSPLQMTTEALC